MAKSRAWNELENKFLADKAFAAEAGVLQALRPLPRKLPEARRCSLADAIAYVRCLQYRNVSMAGERPAKSGPAASSMRRLEFLPGAPPQERANRPQDLPVKGVATRITLSSVANRFMSPRTRSCSVRARPFDCPFAVTQVRTWTLLHTLNAAVLRLLLCCQGTICLTHWLLTCLRHWIGHSLTAPTDVIGANHGHHCPRPALWHEAVD